MNEGHQLSKSFCLKIEIKKLILKMERRKEK